MTRVITYIIILVISSLCVYKNTIVININIDVLLLTSLVSIKILNVKITLIILFESINSEYINEELIDEVLLINKES